MDNHLVDLPDAEGRLLAVPILEPGGRKILARGHLLDASDLRLLHQHGLRQVWVVQVREDEWSEAQVLAHLSPIAVAGSAEARPAPGGRWDFAATEPAALVIHPERLQTLNRSGVAVLCSLPQFSLLAPHQRFATLRSHPFSVPARRAQELLAGVAPCLEVKPLRSPRVVVIYTDPVRPERSRELFDGMVKHRACAFGFPYQSRTCLDEEQALTRLLAETLRRAPDVILVASTMSPVTPADALGNAMRQAGVSLEQFLAPVEPGSLMMLGYAGATAILCAPGCLRSPKANALDIVLAPLLARHRVTADELASLGPAGLLA